MSATAAERVKVWNTFFKLAREQAVSLRRLQNPNWTAQAHHFAGGTLGDQETLSLTVVAWCLLALEAREAHLVEELKDQRKLTELEAKAVHFLGLQEQWALLPKLAGKRTVISFDKVPHQAIAELASLRNDLFHVKYEYLVRRLPPAQKAVSLFNQFVEAMEEMNMILGRHRKPHSKVLKIAIP